MDIYVEKKFNIEKLTPFILLIVIGIVIFFAFKLFNKEEAVEYVLTPLATPNINYEFLTSSEFDALDKFPQYTIFVPGESITPGRANPFSPVSK
jgi:hypothetical protein